MNLWETTLPDRLFAKVAPAGPLECWIWTASLNTGGYGQIYYAGRPQRAHRLTYELFRAEIPEGLQIDHLCRVRACVNPWHLEPVTNAVNTERGDLWKQDRRWSHCKYGHEFAGDNLKIDPSGMRRCRTCERRRSLEAYYRRKAREAAA